MSVERSRTGTILAASVVIAAGFAVAVIEMVRLPKGTIWAVVAIAVGLLAIVRAAFRRTRPAVPPPRYPDRPGADRAPRHP